MQISRIIFICFGLHELTHSRFFCLTYEKLVFLLNHLLSSPVKSCYLKKTELGRSNVRVAAVLFNMSTKSNSHCDVTAVSTLMCYGLRKPNITHRPMQFYTDTMQLNSTVRRIQLSWFTSIDGRKIRLSKAKLLVHGVPMIWNLLVMKFAERISRRR